MNRSMGGSCHGTQAAARRVVRVVCTLTSLADDWDPIEGKTAWKKRRNNGNSTDRASNQRGLLFIAGRVEGVIVVYISDYKMHGALLQSYCGKQAWAFYG